MAYIDRDKFAEAICNFPAIDENSAHAVTLLLHRQPTAYVVEVKHGEWKEYFAFDCWHYDCPFCDDGFATKEKCKTLPNFCGNCGAKMDGVKEE